MMTEPVLVKSPRKFSIRDYFNMYRARGIHLPIQYFFQNHLYDIINGTDTHLRLEKEDYAETPPSFDSGVLYMSSPTNEIKNSLNKIRKRLGNSFYDFQFFDLGCGKGKAVLVYSQLYGKNARHQAIGIDYSRQLIKVANNNLSITGKSEMACFICDDARHFKKFATSKNLILFLYNPFNKDILQDVLNNCSENEIYLIYIDPAHQDLLYDMGFNLVFSKKGRYPNRTISIFSLG